MNRLTPNFNSRVNLEINKLTKFTWCKTS